jgi:hypothetical protein
MTTYAIVARANDAGFDVEVLNHDGVRRTLLAFKTQADAEAWIVRDARLNRMIDPDGFRVQWRYRDASWRPTRLRPRGASALPHKRSGFTHSDGHEPHVPAIRQVIRCDRWRVLRQHDPWGDLNAPG